MKEGKRESMTEETRREQSNRRARAKSEEKGFDVIVRRDDLV